MNFIFGRDCEMKEMGENTCFVISFKFFIFLVFSFQNGDFMKNSNFIVLALRGLIGNAKMLVKKMNKYLDDLK